MTKNYIPIVLFFPNNGCDSPQKIAKKSRQLKYSLSETLAQYYPFAERLTCENYVSCNDEGVIFEKAKLESKLYEILEKLEDVAFDFVFPIGLVWRGFDNNKTLMVVRLSHFDYGGMAMVLCLSHKVADSCTLSNFLSYCEQVLPHFIYSSPDDSIGFQEIQHLEKY